MKKQLITLFTGLVITFLGISSCQKENETPPSNTENITRSSWKFSSATAAGTDISNNPSIACMKDDVIVFLSNGNGSVSEGGNICNPTTAGNFTWTFQNNETKIVMSAGLFPAGSGTFNIVSLNQTTLVVSQDVFLLGAPTSIFVTATYTH